jgi:hypothetical protein
MNNEATIVGALDKEESVGYGKIKGPAKYR